MTIQFLEANIEIARAILLDLKFSDKTFVLKELVDDIGFFVEALTYQPVKSFYQAAVQCYIRSSPKRVMVRFPELLTELEAMGEPRKNIEAWQNKFNSLEPGTASAKAPATALMNHYLRGEVTDITRGWLSKVKQPSSNVREQVAGLVSMLVNLTLDGHSDARPKNILADARKSGIPDPDPTGYSLLDRDWNGGWRRSWLFIIGTPSGHGKSALACNFAVERARQHKPVVINSFEMTSVDLLLRMECNLANITLDMARNPEKAISSREEYEAWRASEELINNYVRIYDQSCSLPEIEARIRRHKAEFGPSMDLFIVDHVGIVGEVDPRQQEWSRLEQTAYALKSICKRQMVGGVVFSQVDSITRRELIENNRTEMGGFRGSAGIYNAVDVAVIGCRHNGRVNNAYDSRFGSVTCLQTQKMRETGRQSYSMLRYQPEYYRLIDQVP